METVKGTALFPIFAPGEHRYPTHLEPITPKLFRDHQKSGGLLSVEQLAALEKMKQFSDFNDLATKSALGRDGLERQLRAATELVEKRAQAATLESVAEQVTTKTEELAPAPKPLRRRAH